jgi:hypothetical protein
MMLRQPLNRSIRGLFVTTARNFADDGSVGVKSSRADRRKTFENMKAATSGKTSYGLLGFGAVLAMGTYIVYDAQANPNGVFGKMYQGSYLEKVIKETVDPVGDIFLPAKNKLLPDFPDDPIYANIPPGTPAPPLLILDVEKTLVGAEHDARHGWRFVKRPGADKLIETLSNYYEIALFSERDMGMAEPIFLALDTGHRVSSL